MRRNPLGSAAQAALCMLAACSGAEGHSATAQPPGRLPVHWIVAVDLSASRDTAQLRGSEDFVDKIPNIARNGDEITLLRISERGLNDPGFLWSHKIPDARDPAHPSPSDELALDDAKRALHAELTVLFDPNVEGSLQRTDIFATLYRVSDIVHADPSRKPVLYLLSDMLQSTHEVNMERSVPDTSWVRQQAEKRFVPKLPGACIVAIGPDVSTERGHAVLAFWRTYFREAGADFRDDNFRNWAPDASGLGCT